MHTVLAESRCSHFLLSLGHLVERRGWRNEIDSEALAVLSQPMPTLADKILTRLHRKAMKRGAHFRRLDVDAQHNLRIHLKKLRYAAEFFLPLYATPAPAKRYVRRLARLQASLGARATSQAPACCSTLSSRTSLSSISPSARWPAGKPAIRLRWRKRYARNGSRRRQRSGPGEFVVCTMQAEMSEMGCFFDLFRRLPVHPR